MTKPYIHGLLPDTAAPEVPRSRSPAAEIRFLGDMQRLQPKPDDVFVLSCEQPIDAATAERIRAQLSGALGGATVLVLDGGIKLGLVAGPRTAVDLAAAPDQSGMDVLECGGVSISMKPPALSPEAVAALVKSLQSYARGNAVHILTGAGAGADADAEAMTSTGARDEIAAQNTSVGYTATTQQVHDAARHSQVHARARADVVVQNFTVGEVATCERLLSAIRRDQRYCGSPV